MKDPSMIPSNPQEVDAIQETFAPINRNNSEVKAFGMRLYNQFEVNKAYRRPKELEWLESLRQFKGIYDPNVVIDANNSKVYPKYTRSKCNVVLSRLHEMLFPENDKNWSISPTPDPKVSKDVTVNLIRQLIKKKKDFAQMMNQSGNAQMSGEIQDMTAYVPQIPKDEDFKPSVDEVRIAISDFVSGCCERMSDVIEDQLIEMDYPEETKKVLKSGLIFGTGVMKGPMINARSKRIWTPNDVGEFEESLEKEEVPFFESVRLWDWYPDMTITDIDKSEGSYERHQMSKHDVRTLLKRPDYYADLISEYLEAHPEGDYSPESWEVDLQTIEMEASIGREGHVLPAGATNDTATRQSNRQVGKKYEVLEFWGYVDGSDLAACGIYTDDVSLEYAANVWLLGKTPIKVALYDGALSEYKVFYYEKDETSMFGEGLPRVMRHSALSIGAAARMMLDNGACVAGPQVEVNIDLLTEDTDLTSFYPRKIWWRQGRGPDSQYNAIRSVNFDSHIPDLLKIMEKFEQVGDIETTLPTWLIGQMVHNETAQAASGRMQNITISIKDIVKNFDTFTERIIRDLYAWNMEFNPRQDIKGDFGIKAKGVASLVMKEVRMQMMMQLMQTLAPEDWVYLDRREMLKQRLDAYDIKLRLKTEEEAEQIRQAIQNSLDKQLAIESTKADTRYRDAQTVLQLARAKEKSKKADETPSGTDPRLTEAEIEAKKTQTQLGIAKTQQEMGLKDEKHHVELGQSQEKHDMGLIHQHEKHTQELAHGSEDHATEISLKRSQAKAKINAQKARPSKKEK